jgi:hypothetical protein
LRAVKQVIKLQIDAGKANPSPPIGPALGAAGVNIMEFCKAYNAQTQDKSGEVIPVEISVMEVLSDSNDLCGIGCKCWMQACCSSDTLHCKRIHHSVSSR